ncbi:hypothetical protein [Oceanicoccus sp. KOV_DT_Chl]|uniref:hypothetical protein n=1 Tax=Oceanicoccus sp. KOV_DT_Chl TaxID=1904639 RepID=UPI0011AFB6F4|nr:hypothetical protein [Oceanicoccus sp. KOV_DT_Chl]
MKSFSSVILEKADQLLAASKSLDYDRIALHEPEEVEKLQTVLASLQITKKRISESLDQYANKQQSPVRELDDLDGLMLEDSGGSDDKAAEASSGVDKEAMLSQLADEGFGDRVGRVYNSFAGNRSLPFAQVPHERGLPEFLVVLAPDFTPVAGLHGIFITDKEIISMILPSDKANIDWTVIKSKGYSNEEEMIEFLTLIAAGFDVP